MKSDLVYVLIGHRPIVIWSLGLSIIMYGVFLFFIGKIDLKGHGRIATLFVGLEKRNLWQLSFSWVKMCLVVSLLLSKTEIDLVYTCVLVFIVLILILIRPVFSIIGTELIGNLIVFASLWVETYLLEYQYVIRKSLGVKVAYWLLAVFIIVSSVFILLREAVIISGERRDFDENGDTE